MLEQKNSPKYYVGVDIGGTNVRIVIADEEQILIKISSETKKTGSPDTLVNQLIDLIEEGLKNLNISKEQIEGIGTSSAGPFVDGISIKTPNICGKGNDWDIIPYIKPLKTHFGNNKRYELANDCVSSVKAEYLFGAGKGYSDCVYITVSTGIGTGIISDNHLVEGKGHNAGHFGHMIVKKNGALCGCGQHGCIESIVSGTGIARRAKEAGLKYENVSEITAKEVCELYRKNDPIARAIIKETIEYLGILFINIINATDTSILIIGGSIFLYDGDIFMELVKKYIKKNSFQPLTDGVDLVIAKLGKYVGDIAGLSLVIPNDWVEKWIKIKPWEKGINHSLSI